MFFFVFLCLALHYTVETDTYAENIDSMPFIGIKLKDNVVNNLITDFTLKPKHLQIQKNDNNTYKQQSLQQQQPGYDFVQSQMFNENNNNNFNLNKPNVMQNSQFGDNISMTESFMIVDDFNVPKNNNQNSNQQQQYQQQQHQSQHPHGGGGGGGGGIMPIENTQFNKQMPNNNNGDNIKHAYFVENNDNNNNNNNNNNHNMRLGRSNTIQPQSRKDRIENRNQNQQQPAKPMPKKFPAKCDRCNTKLSDFDGS